MFGKKKLGFKQKPRTIAEINQDYNHHAAQAGHKMRVILKIQEEIDLHVEKMHSIDSEAKALPPEPPKPATPPPDDSTANQEGDIA